MLIRNKDRQFELRIDYIFSILFMYIYSFFTNGRTTDFGGTDDGNYCVWIQSSSSPGAEGSFWRR